MKIQQFIALVALAALASSSWAGGRCGPGGGTPPSGGPDCVVTWDFTNPNSVGQGDPLTYTGTSNEGGTFNLAIRGFTIGTSSNSDASWRGRISDSQAIRSIDGSGTYGIGVKGAGESDHWGGKIDNFKRNAEQYKVRDAILLDFEDCVVSLDQIKLQSIADTDFELWSIGGGKAAQLALAIANDSSGDPNLATVLDDYDDWAANGDYKYVTTSLGNASDRVATITNTDVSRFFMLIAGDDTKSYNDDAFRMMRLSANCDNANCDDPGTPPSSVPVPGTLALLGLGVLAARRKLFRA